MKFLFSILALLLTVKECDQKESSEETDKTEIVNNNETAKIQQEDFTIEYTAISRGMFRVVIINNKTISVKNNRNSEPSITECSEELWNDILQKLKSIDVKGMQNLVAPTQKRLYDGAAHANLKVTIDDQVYQTQGFDHGSPPKEIELICNKILEISVDKKE